MNVCIEYIEYIKKKTFIGNTIYLKKKLREKKFILL